MPMHCIIGNASQNSIVDVIYIHYLFYQSGLFITVTHVFSAFVHASHLSMNYEEENLFRQAFVIDSNYCTTRKDFVSNSTDLHTSIRTSIKEY